MPGVGLGATASVVVCCVHDREKRRVVTEAQVAQLATAVGVVYDPKYHKIWLCACCQNLFVESSDEPQFCPTCRGPLHHTPAGPLPEPNERPL